VDAVIINAAGCGHTLKQYGHILQDDRNIEKEKAKEFAANVKDVQEFLDTAGLTAKLSPADQPLTLVYQMPVIYYMGKKISLQLRQLLRQIPGVKLREPIDAALCCGSAGVYNLLQPEVADELGEQKSRICSTPVLI